MKKETQSNRSAKRPMAPPRCAETPRSNLRQTLLPLRGVPEFRSAGRFQPSRLQNSQKRKQGWKTRSLGRTRRPRYRFATGRGIRREWEQTPFCSPPLIQSSCEAVALASGFRRPLGWFFRRTQRDGGVESVSLSKGAADGTVRAAATLPQRIRGRAGRRRRLRVFRSDLHGRRSGRGPTSPGRAGESRRGPPARGRARRRRR